MAKEKRAEVENKKKERTFFYEIVGIICILVSLISLARLGLIGRYGMLLFRLLFGDWYFIFIFLLAGLGIFFLFAHQRFEVKSIRYLGLFIILFSLLTLTHFTMHHYVSSYEGNAFQLTISLYFDYFKTQRGEMMVGGGLIGCCLFYLCYYLLSSIGTIFICCIFIFVGIVFISKKTMLEFIQMLGSFFKKCFGGAFHFSKKLKTKMELFDKDYQITKKKPKKVSKKVLQSMRIDQSKQNTIALKYVVEIKKILDHLNIFYQEVTYMVCNHISVFFIHTYQTINYEVFTISLKRLFVEPFLIRYDEENKIVILEVNNQEASTLSFKEALEQITENHLVLTIGKDDRNQYIHMEDNFLVVTRNNRLYELYLHSLLLFPMFQSSFQDINYILLDLNGNLENLEKRVTKYEANTLCIEDLISELDYILKELSQMGVNTIDEYNKRSSNRIKKPLIYINGLERIINDERAYAKFEYLLVTGTQIGYQFIAFLTNDILENSSLMSSFSYKLFLNNEFSFVKKYLGFDVMKKLNQDIEGFLRYRDLTIRISLLLLTKEELQKII